MAASSGDLYWYFSNFLVTKFLLSIQSILQAKLKRDCLTQWFSNCASQRPGASFQFSKGVAGYFGFVPLSLGFIASKEF